MAQLQQDYDLIIVGSGGGSMCAALAAKALGKRAVILEKQAVVGGSTSFSGGVWWIPDHPLLARAGVKDSYENGKAYLDNVVKDKGPSVTTERTHTYLKAGPKMIAFLEAQGMKMRRPTDPWPDYYDELPGGLPGGAQFWPSRSTSTNWVPRNSISHSMPRWRNCRWGPMNSPPCS